MERADMLALLEQLKAGAISHEAAVRSVEHATFQDLGFARLDHQRLRRTGFGEVVYAEGKSDAQLVEICRALAAAHPRLLVTRLDPERHRRLAADLPPGHFNATARTLSVGLGHAKSLGRVCIVCAGTADLPVAQEALETARLLDCRVELVADVGVAGLHRLLGELERIRQARVVVVCAGMEGALPSVVGGLVRAPVIAVPTSVGYGANLGGVTALLAMMNSCAAGVTVVNIDNGFGAGFAAALINTLPPAE